MTDKILPDGANVLRWKCGADGCFNIKCRPKIEYFFDCFPGKIGLGDVDASVEINWNFLYLEWKRIYQEPDGAQCIQSFRRTANGDSTVFYIIGNPETMDVSHLGVFWCNEWSGLFECDFEGLKQHFRRWVEYAYKNSTPCELANAAIYRRRCQGPIEWPSFMAYDANADMEGSLNVAYAAIRERMARGQPGWTPQLSFPLDARDTSGGKQNAATGGPDTAAARSER